MGAVLVITFFTALAIGVPIAFALGIAAVIVLVLIDPGFLALVPQRMFNGLDLFALVAIPFFILAGELMGSSGILERILQFSRLVAGRMRGSLAQVNIIVSMVFGWINGSGVAGASAVGSMLIKPTAKEYNDGPLACAITGCSSIAGPIIPPSVPMIVYALVAQNVSVAGLFAAGIVPGLMIAFGMMIIVYIIAHIRGFKADPLNATWAEKFDIIRKFGVAFMLPFIMVGGIVGGVFTPVEAGAVAVFYAIIVGFFFTRSLTFASVKNALLRTGITSAVVFLMMGVANIASWILTTQQVPQTIGMTMQQFTQDPLVFLLLVNITLLLVGLLFDTVAAMVMFGPILIPMATMYGIDPIHFGIVFVLNLTIGLVTPPVGICLFITSGIGKVPIEKVFRASMPFLAWLFTVLMIVTYFPAVFMWVPQMLGYR